MKPDFKIITSDGKKSVKIQCPECGFWGYADADQFRGEVSLDCPSCNYHETHDLRKDFGSDPFSS
jgi:DNA-directed RNA polymerase subunit RPC12/RpoP